MQATTFAVLPFAMTVTDDQVNRCCEFAEEMGRNNQSIEFNNRNTKPRTVDQIAHDNLVGKIAEVAVQEWIANEVGAAVSEVDFRILGENKKDSGDLVVGGIHVSIKSTEKGRILLVHEGQLRHEVADLYIVCQTIFSEHKPTGAVNIIGYTTKTDLLDEEFYQMWLDQQAQCAKCLPISSALCGRKSAFVQAGHKVNDIPFIPQTSNLYVRHTEQRKNLSVLIATLRSGIGALPLPDELPDGNLRLTAGTLRR